MRDILNDLENGQPDTERNPMRQAQKHMATPLPKRFYAEATIAEAAEGQGYVIHLDGRTVRTPGSAALVMPTAKAARLVADEYAAQKDVINPATMPVTRLANTAFDGVANHAQAVAEDLLRFSSSDLLFYRADAPEKLVELQAQAWDPVLDWAQAEMGAHFMLAEGILHVEQPREAMAAVSAHLRSRNEPFRLAAMHVMTFLTGSALLAFAVEAKAITVEEAWKAAHVDEDWNIAQWGEDSDAAARRALREKDMQAAAALLVALEG